MCVYVIYMYRETLFRINLITKYLGQKGKGLL